MNDEKKIGGLWARLEAGDAAGVAAELGSLPDDVPVVFLTLKGRALLESGDPVSASAVFDKVLERDPENPVAQLFLVLALFEEGNDREAGDLLMRRAILHPHRGFLQRFVRLFWPLRFSSSLGRAPVQQIAVDPEDPFEKQYHAVKGETPPEQEKPTSSESIRQVAREALTTPGRRAARRRALADRYLRRGAREFSRGRLETTRLLFARALELRPRHEVTVAHYAYIQWVLGQPETGLRVLEPFVRDAVAAYDAHSDPDRLPGPDTLVCYAWCLHELGRFDDALRVLALVQPEGPEDYGAWFLAAVSWLMLGRHEEFAEAFRFASTDFFIDTWEQLLRPFVLRVGTWLVEEGGRGSQA